MSGTATAEPKRPSLMIQMAVLLALTAGAAGAGWMSGSTISGQFPAAGPEETGERATVTSTAEMARAAGIVQIAPITTNLGAPADMWVRLELSLVFDGEPDIAMAEQIHQDLLAYMRTVKAHQIEGASGFLHLKADLTERAAIRSGGAVREVLFRTMLFE
jgi:flagellar protein FliL